MKLPHGLSPIWLSIPAIIFILIVGFLASRLPVFRAATIQNPQGNNVFVPTPAPKLSQPDMLSDVMKGLDNFTNVESAMQMPIIDTGISLPID